MHTITFYEKPGCVTNAKQKKHLARLGVKLVVRNLLTEKWTPEELRQYFKGYLVSEWFNPTAPAIKHKEIDPERITADAAIERMIADPILIRRPLLDIDGRKILGFNIAEIESLTGKFLYRVEQNISECSRSA